MRNALNIYKRKDGRFEGRIPFGRNDNGSLKYRYFYSKDIAELKDKMLSAYTSIEKYNTISCAKTLSEICAEWLSCAKLRVKRSSYCCYERNINKHILPYFKKTKYSELNSVKINAFIEYLLKNGKSNGKGGLSSKTIRDNIGFASFRRKVCRKRIRIQKSYEKCYHAKGEYKSCNGF